SEIARRQYVGPPETEHQIDLGRPSPDALQLHQLDHRRFIRQAGDRLEVERSALDRLGNRPGIDHLLPAESNLAEVRLAEIEDGGRRADADGRFESLGNGAI